MNNEKICLTCLKLKIYKFLNLVFVGLNPPNNYILFYYYENNNYYGFIFSFSLFGFYWGYLRRDISLFVFACLTSKKYQKDML